jgi:hypothetical protein
LVLVQVGDQTFKKPEAWVFDDMSRALFLFSSFSCLLSSEAHAIAIYWRILCYVHTRFKINPKEYPMMREQQSKIKSIHENGMIMAM